MTRRNLLLGATSAMLLALTTSQASADYYTPSSESMTTPTMGWAQNEQAAALGTLNLIEVLPGAETYDAVKPTKLALPFRVHAEVTKIRWRIWASHITIGDAPIQSGGWLDEFSPYNYATLVPHSPSKDVNRDAWWTADVGNNSIATRARNACRNTFKELQQQGMSRKDIFSQDRHTTLPTEFHYVAMVDHKNPNKTVSEAGEPSRYWKQSQAVFQDINVTCLKDGTSEIAEDPTPPSPPPSGSNDIAIGFQIKQAALAITPNDYKGKCPAKLHLNPTIETMGKGTVKYRFVDQLGNKSQTFQVKFDKSDVKFLDHVIEIDGKGKPKGLGFKAQQSQGGGLGLVANTQPNLTQGYFKIEVIAPHKKVSNLADYSVKCTAKTAGNDALAPKPDVVKPGVVVGDLVLPTADLVVESVDTIPYSPNQVRVTVANKGAAIAPNTSIKALRWVGDSATNTNTPVGTVKVGESKDIVVDIGGSLQGATHVYVRVDDPNQVKESNEGNNSFKVK